MTVIRVGPALAQPKVPRSTNWLALRAGAGPLTCQGLRHSQRPFGSCLHRPLASRPAKLQIFIFFQFLLFYYFLIGIGLEPQHNQYSLQAVQKMGSLGQAMRPETIKMHSWKYKETISMFNRIPIRKFPQFTQNLIIPQERRKELELHLL